MRLTASVQSPTAPSRHALPVVGTARPQDGRAKPAHASPTIPSEKLRGVAECDEAFVGDPERVA
jgi:hypothetical protein